MVLCAASMMLLLPGSPAFEDGFSGTSLGPWQTTELNGWQVGDGVLRCATDDAERIILAPTAPIGEALVQVDLRFIGGQRRNASIAFGAQDAANYWAIRRYDARQWLELLHFVSGEAIRVQGNHWLAESGQGSAALSDGEWYRMEVALIGHRVLARVYPRDATPPEWMLHTEQDGLQPGRIGLVADQTVLEFDNFRVDTGEAFEAICRAVIEEGRARAARAENVTLAADAHSTTCSLRFPVDMPSRESRAEMVFLAADAQNHYSLSFGPKGLVLTKWLDGRPQVLASDPTTVPVAPGEYVLEVEVQRSTEGDDGPVYVVDEAVPPPVVIRCRASARSATPTDWPIEVHDDPLVPGAVGEPYWHPSIYEGTSARYPFGTRVGVVRQDGVAYERPRITVLPPPPKPPCASLTAWRTVHTGDRGGCWLAVGDLDGDGRAELLTVRNDDQVVRSVTAFDLNGREMWRWGEGGGANIYCDEPCTVYDIDDDGCNEVLLSIEGHLVALDGRSGREKARHPLPEGLTTADCIIIANLRGRPRAEDIIIKSRYDHLWAYTADWEPLWEWSGNTGHHPDVRDVDGDVRDEVLCGFALLDHDGSVLWNQDLPGHADSTRIITETGRPLFLMTCCGGCDMALADLGGRILWHRRPTFTDHHYQSTHIGKMTREVPGLQIAVDEGWGRAGRVRTWTVSLETGRTIGTYTSRYPRFDRLVDWDGDGLMELFIPGEAALFDAHGRCEAKLTDALPLGGPGEESPMARVRDVDGDGCDELILFNAEEIRIYRMRGTVHDTRGGVNFTYY